MENLLPYYNRELAFLRQSGKEFAKAYPHIAGYLDFHEGQTPDPHVERLIEAVAFLNAKTNLTLDEEFPQISHALLRILYPHYLASIPSLSVVQFKSKPDLEKGYEIKKDTVLDTNPLYGEVCHFKTCYNTTILPLKMTKAVLSSLPYTAPVAPGYEGQVKAVLHIQLTHQNKAKSLGSLQFDKVRFFLNLSPDYRNKLYEMLFNHTVCFVASGGHEKHVVFSTNNLKPVGFDRDEGILPYSPRSFLGYRFLTEFFCFQEKYFFFDLEGLREITPHLDKTIDLFFYVDQYFPDLSPHIHEGSFLLGCTPIVNIFPLTAEPFALDHKETEYRVIPDARRPSAVKAHTVQEVFLVAQNQKKTPCLPFYGLNHDEESVYWNLSTQKMYGSQDIFLSFTDHAFRPLEPEQKTVVVELLCTNGSLPSQLGNLKDYLQIEHATSAVQDIVCLFPFTPVRSFSLNHQQSWRLISHLSFNIFSFVEDIEAFKELLRLYHFNASAYIKGMIDSILSLKAKKITRRFEGLGTPFLKPYPQHYLCEGLEISLTFEDNNEKNVFLFSCILDHFFALCCTLNSFTQLVVFKEDREIKRWPCRSGLKPLL